MPYYPEAIKFMIKGLQEDIADTERFLKTNKDLLRKAAALAPESRPCPFCAGKMLDLSDFLEIDPNSWKGHSLNTMVNERENYGARIPNRWECQKCGVFDIAPPNFAKIETRPVGKQSLGGVLVRYFPNIEEIHYTCLSCGYGKDDGYVIKLEGQWYLMRGSAKSIKTVLGIK